MFQDMLEGAEWGADLPSVENNLTEQNTIHTAVEELMGSIQEARNYEVHTNKLTHAHTHIQAHAHTRVVRRAVFVNDCVFSFLSSSLKCLLTSRAVTQKPWPSWNTSTTNYWSVLT